MFTFALRRGRSSRFDTYGLLLALTMMVVAPAQAATIYNGSFENIGSQNSSFFITATNLPGWAASPTGNQVLDCLVIPTETADLCGGAAGWSMEFWNNGNPGAFPGGASPDGGNYVAIDGDAAYATPIRQTITGLVVGQQYVISFWQAAGQEHGRDGATTERWQVSLGTESHLSTLMNTPNHGFVNWMRQNLTFTAQNTTDVLSFLAVGTPSGLPPFVLLDGVSINTPEPGALSLVGLGGFAMFIAGKFRKRR